MSGLHLIHISQDVYENDGAQVDSLPSGKGKQHMSSIFQHRCHGGWKLVAAKDSVEGS